MTFSIAARCQRTGMFGIAIATSSICVGARCPHTRAGIGAVASQNITDPNLATLVLDRLAIGDNSSEALAHVVTDREHIEFRQLTVVDKNGDTACFTGKHILGTHAAFQADHCVAAGNMLANEQVPEQMARVFNDDSTLHLAQRLLLALEAGLNAGGELGPVHSSALRVSDSMPFALVDLRVDWHDTNPIRQLRTLWEAYEPQMQDYLNRAMDPQSAPSYGVAGNP